MYKVLFIHPKNGAQYTTRKTKSEIINWLSYMVAFHGIEEIRLFENSEDNSEINGNELFDFKIPKCAFA